MGDRLLYDRTWCDYLTPCPHRNKQGDPAGVMVGGYECSICPYHMSEDRKKHIVVCAYTDSKFTTKINLERDRL